MYGCQTETLDQVVLIVIQQNGIEYVVDNYTDIRDDYYDRKESNRVS
jgi:hypothetical protein